MTAFTSAEKPKDKFWSCVAAASKANLLIVLKAIRQKCNNEQKLYLFNINQKNTQRYKNEGDVKVFYKRYKSKS